KYADRAAKIDSKDTHAAVIKARALTAMGQNSAALSLLASLPELEHGGDIAELLIHLYLQEEQTEPAIELGSKIFARNSANFAPLRQVSAKLLEGQQADTALPLIDLIRAVMIEKGEHEVLAQMLGSAAERLPGNIEARQWLGGLFKQTNDSVHLTEALADLAATCNAAGDRKRALQIYEELHEKNPENEAVRREYDKLKGKPADEAPSKPKEIVPPAPPKRSPAPPASNETLLDKDTQRFVSQALTDIDLFSSYGLTQKAIDLLEVVLQRVPGHAPTLERLLDHYVGAGDENRTAELAAQLEQIHAKRGNTAAAERFADLRQRFTQAARTAEPKAAPKKEPPAREFPVAPEAVKSKQAEPVEPVPVAEEETVAQASGDTASQQAAVHEVDLSEEWAALATEIDVAPNQTEEAPPAVPGRKSATPAVEVPAFDAVAEMQEALRAESPVPAARNASTADYALELAGSQTASEGSKGGPATAQDFL